MTRRVLVGMATAAVLAAAGSMLAASVHAAEANPGRTAYLKYCSACHGPDGKGDGIVSGAMRPKPADLTLLAKNNGGKFPYMRVKDIIDGRKPIAAHGNSEMPVWGQILTEETASTQGEARVRAKVQQITNYLASIQVK